MKNILNNRFVTGTLLLVAGVFLGWVFFSPTAEETKPHDEHEHAVSEIWTCSMHPSVRQPGPGKCPICGMDLIPLGTADDGDPMEVRMSATAIKLANIQTLVIETDQAVKEVRLNGKVQADERRVSAQSAHIPGRIEQLLVNFTGEFVQRGSVMAYVYSPELVTAQQELFEAYKIKETQPVLYNAAREKLKNWKLDDKHIDGILATGKATEKFPLRADVAGVVLKRNVSVGDYVTRGMPIYDIVDLSRVWVQFDVYESDMPWVKKGSQVTFTVQSLPGEKFNGTISFIDPILNPKTRVATARIEIANPGLRLKPEMFATGLVRSDLNGSDKIILPKSAVLWTGERSIVYIKRISEEGTSFIMKEVVLGPSLGDSFVIQEGLESGMEVVTNGTFTIDAAAQLAGKPSMMNPEGGPAMTGHQHGPGSSSSRDNSHDKEIPVNTEFKKQLSGLIDPYTKFKNALVSSNADAAASEARNLNNALKKIGMKKLDPDAHNIWMPLSNAINKATENASNTHDLAAQRKSLSVITDSYMEAINKFSISGLNSFYQYCPMALDNNGGYWISETEEIKNPYFGSKMITCGETIQQIK